MKRAALVLVSLAMIAAFDAAAVAAWRRDFRHMRPGYQRTTLEMSLTGVVATQASGAEPECLKCYVPRSVPSTHVDKQYRSAATCTLAPTCASHGVLLRTGAGAARGADSGRLNVVTAAWASVRRSIR